MKMWYGWRWADFEGYLISNDRSGRTKRTRAKVSAGWSRDRKVLVRGAKGTNWLMILNIRWKILRGICIEGIICYGGMMASLKRNLLWTGSQWSRQRRGFKRVKVSGWRQILAGEFWIHCIYLWHNGLNQREHNWLSQDENWWEHEQWVMQCDFQDSVGLDVSENLQVIVTLLGD